MEQLDLFGMDYNDCKKVIQHLSEPVVAEYEVNDLVKVVPLDSLDENSKEYASDYYYLQDYVKKGIGKVVQVHMGEHPTYYTVDFGNTTGLIYEHELVRI